MSKHKKKKQREYSPPPLSQLDIFTYNIITIVVVLLAFSAFFGIFYVAEVICYADETVMLSYNRWTLFLLAPAWLIAFLPPINFFVTGLNEKKPIFGNKNVNYFSTTRYAKAEFLFKKKSSPKEKKTKLIMALVLAVIVLLCTVFGLIGRNSIYYDGEIKVFSVFNTVKKEYSIDDISKVTIEIGEKYSRYGNNIPCCFVDVETVNGKIFDFVTIEANWNDYKIPEKIANISTLKIVFDNNDISVTVVGKEYIDSFIEYYELTETERKLLVDLFAEV
ncbi:MAG: hypothetical protein IKU66_00875 [Clostridia bacterium]|nr:hypothetical protein [Clostridia bacterium]